jgi:hypothetical protein
METGQNEGSFCTITEFKLNFNVYVGVNISHAKSKCKSRKGYSNHVIHSKGNF